MDQDPDQDPDQELMPPSVADPKDETVDAYSRGGSSFFGRKLFR